MMLLFTAACEAQQRQQRVLFIGNSYTFVNDLPNTYKMIMNSRLPGHSVSVDSSTANGRSLGQAAQDPACQRKVKEGKYDFLVLQDQSCLPGIPDSFFPQKAQSTWALQHFFGPHARRVGAVVVLIETWGRRDGAPVHCGRNPVVDEMFPTFAAMQSKLSSGYTWYKTALEKVGVKVIVVRSGEAHATLHLKEPSLFARLYEADGSHPSAVGQYLTACGLFAALNRAQRLQWKGPAVSWKPAGIAAGEADVIAGAAVPSNITPTVNSMAGDWVGKYELRQPTRWRVSGSRVFVLANGQERPQGNLVADFGALSFQPGGSSVTQLLGDTAWWSDGDVWTRVKSKQPAHFV